MILTFPENVHLQNILLKFCALLTLDLESTLVKQEVGFAAVLTLDVVGLLLLLGTTAISSAPLKALDISNIWAALMRSLYSTRAGYTLTLMTT